MGLLRNVGWLLVVLFWAGCAPVHESRVGPPVVVTTTGMLADLIRHVAGEDVTLVTLFGPGVDPHLYKPKESAIRKMFGADLVIYQGLHLEGKMARILNKTRQARAAGRGIPAELLLTDEGEHDPHVWFDVALWARVLDQVAADLSALRPEHAEVFAARARSYREELLALDAEVRRELATIPKLRRVMVTAHDAFRYFGRAYDLEVVGLQGVSTSNQAGLRKVQEVVDLVTSRGVKALFVESSVPPDGVEAVLARCRSRGHQVRITEEELYSDAMDLPGRPAGTYVGMIRHNVRVIVAALR
jgi:manganese/zinc/iron transport system substrate-binding protein